MERITKFLVRLIGLTKRELISFFISPVAHFVLGALTLVSLYFFIVYLEYFNFFLMQGRSAMMYGGDGGLSLNQLIEGYFRVHLLIMVFVLPILGMKLFAEERRAGVFEFLLTSPITSEGLVLGKLIGFSVFLLIFVAWVAILPISLILYGDYEVPVLIANILGFGFFVVGLGAIAMMVSCLIDNPIIGGIVSLVVLLLIYSLNFMVNALDQTKLTLFTRVVKYLSPMEQIDGFLRGIVKVDSVVYFLSLIFLCFVITVRIVDAKRVSRF
jgi:ABC-2 type transport system permease protein